MRNLLGRLLERSPEELDQIAAFWDVDLGGRDRYADVAAIYRTMTDVWAARDAYSTLPETDRSVISHLRAAGGENVSLPTIADELDLELEITRESAERLRLGGILATEEDEREWDDSKPPAYFLPREIGAVLERVRDEQQEPHEQDETLDDLLSRIPLAELEEAATAWGARVTPGIHPRAELVNIVRDKLQQQRATERLINNLSGQARDSWRALVDNGGRLSLDMIPPNTPKSARERRRVLQELGAPLLIWHRAAIENGAAKREIIVPSEILNPPEVEPQPLPEVQTFESDQVSEPDWVFPQSGAWDLLTLTREAATRGPRWTALVESDPAITRRFRGRMWRIVSDVTQAPTGYIAFLTRVGALLGVLQNHESRAIPGSEARNWRTQAFTTAQRSMVRAWISSETWLEGEERLDLVLQGASWPAYRATLMRALGELDPDLWHDQDAFIQRLIRAEPDLLRQAQVSNVAANQLSMQLDPQASVEERRAHILTLIIGTSLETAGVWLNLIERSQDLSGPRSVMRLTPFGHWIAGPRSEPTGQTLGPAPLSVNANLQLKLYRPTPRRVWGLLTFAELKSLDQISTYVLTPSALMRALSSGLDLKDIVGFLERQSGEPLPETVVYRLNEWDRGYRRIWMRRAVVLEPEEGEDNQKIAAALEDAGLEPELLADGRILLLFDAPDAGERLFSAANRALRERGFAPLSTGDGARQ